MAVYFGKLEEFDTANGDDWVQYIERMEHYFLANEITDASKQRSILISSMGQKACKILRNIVAPEKPTDVSFTNLVSAMTSHFSPPPSEIVQRFRFNSRVRKPGETVAAYIAELRALSEHCNYGNTLESMLRDRLVCGVNDPQIQKRLLAEDRLTFKKALEISLALEAATKDTKQLQAAISTTTPGYPAVLMHKVREGEKSLQSIKCYRCGKANHKAPECRYKDSVCSKCKKRGHLAKVCRNTKSTLSQSRSEPSQTNIVIPEAQAPEEYQLFSILEEGTRNHTKPLTVLVNINDQSVKMEIDTGSAVSIISESLFSSVFKTANLQETETKLCTYSGEQLPVKGKFTCEVCYKGQTFTLPLIVLAGEGPTLLGRDWMQQISLDWPTIFQVNAVKDDPVQQLLHPFESIFKEELGTYRGDKAKIHIDPTVIPKFCKARPLPYAMRELVEKELLRLETLGIIKPMKSSNWAAPIVPVLKPDRKSIRICGDYKLTANKASRLEQYPLPKVEDLFSTLAGGITFTKLDMSQAYQQLVLDDDSKEIVTINTHKGLFSYQRLPFGVSSAPGIFQRTMETILAGIPRVLVYLDDILVTGSSHEEHMSNLKEVLSRLQEAGLRLRKDKCEFMVSSVKYLGHIIDANGLHPAPDKLKAVKNAPKPQNVTELKAYLGLLTYYSRFLPNMATTLSPLYKLLRNNVKWQWTSSEAKAFQKSKELLTSNTLLVHFNPSHKLTLMCDASPYGVGAVLSQIDAQGIERPVAYASRTLSQPEKNYSQLEKEALALIFGTKRFHNYLYGRSFTLYTDHKPLQGLLNESKAIPTLASARIQRWALTLAAYQYKIVYKRGSEISNADGLSRLPLPTVPQNIPLPSEHVLLLEHLSSGPITATQIKTMTRQDKILSKVLYFVQKGWPATVEPALTPYASRKYELSSLDGCVLWGTRVVIPTAGRKRILDDLHETHQGASRMKARARMVVWWPGLDKSIEEIVSNCLSCQSSRPLPPAAPLHPWSIPQAPWSRLHMDYAGPLQDRMFLIIVDAFSKWLEIIPVKKATSSVTIDKLRGICSTHGLPDTIVTDNAAVFTSSEMKEFFSRNGIKHITSAPYHPASNGLAERAVQTFKSAIKRSTEGSLETRIQRFLFDYRITPHSTTGISPANLLMNRQPKSKLDLVVPNLSKRVTDVQDKQKQLHDQHAKCRRFNPGDKVLARSYNDTDSWLQGEVVEVTGPVSYKVHIDKDGKIVRRHQDQLRKGCITIVPEQSSQAELPTQDDYIFPSTVSNDHTEPSVPETAPVRKSTRIRKPPDRLVL